MTKFGLYNIYLNRLTGDLIPIVPIVGVLLLSRNFTLSDISLYLLCLSVTVIITEIPAGRIADKTNHRFIIIISRVLKFLSFVVLFYATSIITLCISSILWGLASSTDSGAIQAYIYKFSQHSTTGLSFEEIYANTFTASLSGLLLSGLIASQIAWLGFELIQFLGISFLFICVLSSLYLPRISNGLNLADHKEPVPIRTSLFTPIIITALIIGIVAGGIKGSADEYIPILLENKNLAIAVIGYVIFGLALVKTLGASLGGKFKVSLNQQLWVVFITGTILLIVSISNYIIVVIGLSFVIFLDSILWVNNDTTIQNSIGDSSRATIASIKNFGIETLAAMVFLAVWLADTQVDVSEIYQYGGLIMIVIAVFTLVFNHLTKKESP